MTRLIKDKMAIPIIFSWSAAFSSSWATLLRCDVKGERYLFEKHFDNQIQVLTQYHLWVPPEHSWVASCTRWLSWNTWERCECHWILCQDPEHCSRWLYHWKIFDNDDNYFGVKWLPLSVEFVSFAFINLSKLLLKVRSQVNGRVQILPYQCVMLYISTTFKWKHFLYFLIHTTWSCSCKLIKTFEFFIFLLRCWYQCNWSIINLLDEILLSDVACGEISNTIHWHYSNVFNSSQ